MIARNMRRLLLLAAVLVATGCRQGQPEQDVLLTPPPAIADFALVSDPAPTQDQHSSNDGADEKRANAPAVTDSSGPVTFGAELSHAQYNRTLPDSLVLKVDLGGKAVTQSKRQPLNLALVFDRSRSMAKEQKFMHAMEAARLLVENLSDQDIVSLIAFNDNAVVLSPAGRAVNKAFLRYRLDQFGPAGYTNLSAGLLEAFAQIDSKSAEGQSKKIIVLTDGIANRGITDRTKLLAIVASAHDRGIGVSTLGCGTEFDEKTLAGIAEKGGGRYTCVRSPEQIPTAMAAELDGMLAVAAQNAKLEIRVTDGGAITRVFGRLIDGPIASYPVELGDIRDGERSIFMVQITPDTFKDGALVSVDVTLTLDNPETGRREVHKLQRKATFTADDQDVRSVENASVMTYTRVLNAMETAEVALRGLDVNRFQQATTEFDHIYAKARQYAIQARDQQLLNETFLLKHFMAELAATGNNALLHDHATAKRRIDKDIDYQRYLLEHHRDSDNNN